jgi:hypothetical protein
VDEPAIVRRIAGGQVRLAALPSRRSHFFFKQAGRSPRAFAYTVNAL